jgi:Xaa-Pro aminopeptidase
VAIADQLAAGGAEIVWAEDPCLLPKATKTAAEIAGARAAHLRDGAAMATFLAWLDVTARAGELTEIEVVTRLEAIRSGTGVLRDIAFETIAGTGPNGAIVHYRVNEATDRPVRLGDLLLVDSGGQYPDGTTDITRTIAVGQPSPAAVRAFTLVVEGLSAMSRLRWPEGLAGSHIDAIARSALWTAGFDYDHGTGHGVGSFLSVHEGPAGLSRRATAPILPGMILSVEPGVYREGEWGIRVENLAVVSPPNVPEGGERPMLGFETLTLAPIDRHLIDPGLLTAATRAWIDAYHARVLLAVGPLVGAGVAAWLEAACAPLRVP